MIRATYMACDFTKPDCNEHRCFDEATFKTYLASNEFQKKLNGRLLVGAISHEARDKFIKYKQDNMSPSVGNQSDYLLSNGLGANIITKAWIENHKLFLTIETLPYGRGLELEALYKLGMNMQVSMSTELDIMDGKYFIVNLFGLDCTVAPAFETELIGLENV